MDPLATMPGMWTGTLSTSATFGDASPAITGSGSRTINITVYGPNLTITGLFDSCAVRAFRDECELIYTAPAGSGCIELEPAQGCMVTLGNGQRVSFDIIWTYGYGYITPQRRLVLSTLPGVIMGGGRFVFTFNGTL
jgi:hypothetical protein